jgi:hypothetical protein
MRCVVLSSYVVNKVKSCKIADQNCESYFRVVNRRFHPKPTCKLRKVNSYADEHHMSHFSKYSNPSYQQLEDWQSLPKVIVMDGGHVYSQHADFGPSRMDQDHRNVIITNRSSPLFAQATRERYLPSLPSVTIRRGQRRTIANADCERFAFWPATST